MKKPTPQKNEKWVSGLSDCCEAPLKEVGTGLTILICAECDEMCNKRFEEQDDFTEDFFDED